MIRTSSALAAGVLAAALPAQSLDLLALNHILASAGGQTNTLPAGVMPAAGVIAAGIPVLGPVAGLSWESTASASHLSLSVGIGCTSPSPSPVSVGGGDILVQLTSPVPCQALLELTVSTVVAPGAAPAVARMDVHYDGTWEVDETNQAGNVLVNLGPVPVVVGIRLSGSLAVAGQTTANVELSCRPLGGTTATSWFRGCGPNQLAVEPTFQGDLEVAGSPLQNEVVFAVFGLGLQPLTLGARGNYPCILLPSIDAEFLLTTSAVRTLALPPSLRPLQFWAQGVVLGPAGVATTDAFLIQAR